MGMSKYASGVRDLDGTFAMMVQVKLACEAANIGYPQEVNAYFGTPGESVEHLRREMEKVNISQAIRNYDRDGTDGFEVILSKLPEGVKSISFETSH